MQILNSEKVKEGWKVDEVVVEVETDDGEVREYEFALRKQYIMMHGIPLKSVWGKGNPPEFVEDYVRKEYA